MPSLPQLAHKRAVLPTQSDFASANDMSMILGLLKSNPLYNIPSHLRTKIVNTAENLLDTYSDNPDNDNKTKLAAMKVLLEADKRNLDLLKMAIPKKTEIKNIQDATTEELMEKLKEILINNPQLIPVEVINNG